MASPGRSQAQTTEVVEVVDVTFGRKGSKDYVNIVAADGRVFGSTYANIRELADQYRDAGYLQLTWHLETNGRWKNLYIDDIEVPDLTATRQAAQPSTRIDRPAPVPSAELTARAADIAERLTRHDAAATQKVPPLEGYEARMTRFVALIPILVRVFETGGQSLDTLADLGDILGVDGLAAVGLLTTTGAGEAIKSEPTGLEDIDYDADLPWGDAGSGIRIGGGDRVVTWP